MSLVYSLKKLTKVLEHENRQALATVTGEKTANLVELNSLGISIPQCFSISKDAFAQYTDNVSDELWSSIMSQVGKIEKSSGFKFGGADMPLLLSCRCDSPYPMNGMLDTVVNIGLNDLTARGLGRISNNRAFVWDSYRRLVQNYGVVVLKISNESFEDLLVQYMQSRKKASIAEFTDLDWIEVTKLYKSVIMRKTGNPFPQDPHEQLKRVVNAILGSYNSERAKLYREYVKIPENSGISILVSAMKYGNNGKKSCAAVVSSRSPVDGSSELYGEYCINATITDIVESKCPVKPIAELKSELSSNEYKEIEEITRKIEKHFKVPQRVDLINDNGRITVLQARPLGFQAVAKFKAVWEMASSGIITKNEALAAIRPDDLKHLMMPKVDLGEKVVKLGAGLSAGNETVTGKVCLSVDAVAKAAPGESVILVKEELVPKDFKAFTRASAIVTAKGGNFSHVAALSRFMMKTAAMGLKIELAADKKSAKIGGKTVKDGDAITVCGNGLVYKGAQKTKETLGFDSPEAAKLLDCADQARKGKLAIYTTANSAAQVGATKDVGGDGCGLFPLESIFTDKTTILIRGLLDKRRSQALAKIESLIEKTVGEVLVAAKGMPVVFRLFNPPPYTFMQNINELAVEIAKLKAKSEMTEDNDDDGEEDEGNAKDKELNKKLDAMENIKSLQEKNPIYGLKGIRMNLVQTDFLTVQLKGILKGIKSAASSKPKAKILVPFVAMANEVAKFRSLYNDASLEIGATAEIGVEVSLPRTCLAVKSIAEQASFFMVRPTELTESVFSCDRAHAERTFLKDYCAWKFLSENPFTTIDTDGVGKLIKICVDGAKSKDKNIEIGAAGEMCGDPRSIAFMYNSGVSSITCDFAVVPIARLCSAQAIIAAEGK